MSVLVPLALLIGLLVGLPVLAHALRKGKTAIVVFPAARLVPAHTSSQKERRRLEDRALLAVRALAVLALALLAASPLVKCSRLSLNRTQGASVAAALVIDDSASMRARLDGQSKLQISIAAAEQLIESAQAGDAFSIVLAGAPARVLSPRTTDLATIRDALSNIAPSDRETDLGGALRLARSAQEETSQSDRPIFLLSDMAIDNVDSLDLSGVVVPELGLRAPLRNCALTTASRGSDSVQVEVACSTTAALGSRTIRILSVQDEEIATAVPARDGVTLVPLPDDKAGSSASDLRAVLSAPPNPENDQISEDDTVLVLDASTRLSVAVRADQSTAGLKTGAGTVIQAGLEALKRDLRLTPLSVLPESVDELSSHAAIFIDDPSGFTPEISTSLRSWMSSGGVALVFLGPNVRQAPLGSNFEPFVYGATRWEPTSSKGPSATVAGSLGPLTPTWAEIGSSHRVQFDEQTDVTQLSTFDDGHPLVYERPIGRGLAVVVSLPASVDQSDLALRPAFLELLDYVVTSSAFRRGVRATPTGERWNVLEDARVTAPDGTRLTKETNEQTGRSFVAPPLAGQYEIVDESGTTIRYAVRHREEHVRLPVSNLKLRAEVEQQLALSDVDVSREVALALMLLSLLELAIRVRRRPRTTRSPASGSILPSAPP